MLISAFSSEDKVIRNSFISQKFFFLLWRLAGFCLGIWLYFTWAFGDFLCEDGFHFTPMQFHSQNGMVTFFAISK